MTEVRAAAIEALVAKLNAGLDADDAAARATSRPAWREWYVEPWYDGQFQEDGRTMRADLGGRRGGGLFTGQGALDTVLAEHIARQDPARTEREVKAKRDLMAAILAEPHTYIAENFYSGQPGSGCSDPDRAGQPCDCGRDQRVERLLRIMAQVYDNNEGGTR
jgi:hypothetical protein